MHLVHPNQCHVNDLFSLSTTPFLSYDNLQSSYSWKFAYVCQIIANTQTHKHKHTHTHTHSHSHAHALANTQTHKHKHTHTPCKVRTVCECECECVCVCVIQRSHTKQPSTQHEMGFYKFLLQGTNTYHVHVHVHMCGIIWVAAWVQM